MRPSRMVLIAVCFVLTAKSAFALDWTCGRATEWVRITENGRTVGGALAPDGESIAFVRLRKQFTSEGLPFFHRALFVLQDGQERHILQLPASTLITYTPELRHTAAEASVTWLPSSEVLACRTDYQDWLLLRMDNRATTAVTREDEAGLTHEDRWDLSAADRTRLLEVTDEHPWWHDPLGQRVFQRDLPGSVPEKSEDWYYEDFRRSPTDPNLALYTGADRHFDGCCCTAYLNHRYLGVVDMTPGRMRRLTWGRDHTVAHCRWIPDGSHILYLRRPYAADSRWEFTGSDLHIMRPDGTADRHLIAGVDGFSKLDEHRIMVFLGAHGWRGGEAWWHDWEQQLAVLDLDTLSVKRLTAGHFHHDYLDHRGDTFLVREMPVGQGVNEGDLFLIRPL